MPEKIQEHKNEELLIDPYRDTHSELKWYIFRTKNHYNKQDLIFFTFRKSFNIHSKAE